MSAKVESVVNAILRVLNESEKPIGASQIASHLLVRGIDLQPRAIRYHLIRMDEGGLTRLVSRRKGREITENGRREVLRSENSSTVGIVSAKVDTLAYRMTFNGNSNEGSVIVNVTLIDPKDAGRVAKDIQMVQGQGFTTGSKILIGEPGEEVAGSIVPDGFLAIGTICSVTLNGVFQKHGIPVVSRFGGLLEIRERGITRFLNMIEYRGSTLDPIDVFIRADMTRVRNVVLRGSGIVCASFREIPSAAIDQVKTLVKEVKKYGIGGVLAIGRPNQPLFGINVSEGHCGLVAAGGLNGIAAAKEGGARLSFHSLAGLEDFSRFQGVREFMKRTR